MLVVNPNNCELDQEDYSSINQLIVVHSYMLNGFIISPIRIYEQSQFHSCFTIIIANTIRIVLEFIVEGNNT